MNEDDGKVDGSRESAEEEKGWMLGQKGLDQAGASEANDALDGGDRKSLICSISEASDTITSKKTRKLSEISSWSPDTLASDEPATSRAGPF